MMEDQEQRGRKRKSQNPLEEPSHDSGSSRSAFRLVYVWALLLLFGSQRTLLLDPSLYEDGRQGRGWSIKRKRVKVEDIAASLGDYRFRRAYRMSKQKFRNLVSMLRPHIKIGRRRRKRQRRRGHGGPARYMRCTAPNGVISAKARVSVTLRVLAGGDPNDIAVVHGINTAYVYKGCVWPVINAIHRCPSLHVEYPRSHEEQEKIAREFQRKSAVSFDTCAGAIDGILIWTEKPSEVECREFGNLQSGSFFCGRKHKFGFNMQAICDANLRFLEFWITHPASASDFMTFMSSPFYKRLSNPSFLKPGLALFGDNAYVSSWNMATPYKSAKHGVMDDYNFFHSQLRIRIEMAFGVLTRRWGILRKPMSVRFGMQKQIALASACIRLHNYCLEIPEDDSDDVQLIEPLPLSVGDELAVQREGGLVYGRHGRPDSLLDGGDHFDDVNEVDHLFRRKDSVRRRMRVIVERSGFHRAA